MTFPQTFLSWLLVSCTSKSKMSQKWPLKTQMESFSLTEGCPGHRSNLFFFTHKIQCCLLCFSPSWDCRIKILVQAIQTLPSSSKQNQYKLHFPEIFKETWSHEWVSHCMNSTVFWLEDVSSLDRIKGCLWIEFNYFLNFFIYIFYRKLLQAKAFL